MLNEAEQKEALDGSKIKAIIARDVHKTWTWDVVGGGILVIAFNNSNPQPSWWRRWKTKFFLGSKWTKHKLKVTVN